MSPSYYRRQLAGLLRNGVVLLHDNDRLHISHETKSLLQKFKWEIVEHPVYSPDLSPYDFHLFSVLKKELKGKHFHSDDEAKNAVTKRLRSQPKKFYEQGINVLPKQRDNCLQIYGDYF